MKTMFLIPNTTAAFQTMDQWCSGNHAA